MTQTFWDEKNATTDWLGEDLFDQYEECDGKFLGFKDKVPYYGCITNDLIFIERVHSSLPISRSFIKQIKELFAESDIVLQIEEDDFSLIIKPFWKNEN